MQTHPGTSPLPSPRSPHLLVALALTLAVGMLALPSRPAHAEEPAGAALAEDAAALVERDTDEQGPLVEGAPSAEVVGGPSPVSELAPGDDAEQGEPAPPESQQPAAGDEGQADGDGSTVDSADGAAGQDGAGEPPAADETGAVPADDDMPPATDSSGTSAAGDAPKDTTPEQPVTALQPLAEAKLPVGPTVLRSALAHVLVMDKAGGLKANATANAQLYPSNMSAAQRLTISYDAKSGYAAIALADGTVLDVADGKAVKGANVRWWRSNGSLAQRWSIVDGGDGTIVLFSALDKALCIDVTGGLATSGANLRLWSSNNSKAQRFHPISLHGCAAPVSNVDIDGRYFEVVSTVDGGIVLDVASGSKQSGATVRSWTRNGSLAQAWRFEATGDGYYLIRAAHSQAALTVRNGNVVPTTPVQQDAVIANGTSRSQHWSVTRSEDGTYRIFAAQSGLALDLRPASTAKGIAMRVETQGTTPAQRWALRPLSDASRDKAVVLEAGVYRLESAQRDSGLYYPALVATVAGGSASNGANLSLQAAASSVSQQFEVRLVAGGPLITFVSPQTGKAIDVAGGSRWPHANVQMYRSNGTAAQQWLAYLNADGTYSLHSASSGLALEASSSFEGANLRIGLVSTSYAQHFRLVRVADNRALSALLAAGEVSSVRLIGDSISDGLGLSGYSTAPRGKSVALDTGSTTYYESPASLKTFSHHFRQYLAGRGIDDYVCASVTGKTMADLASYGDGWLQGGADVIVVTLGRNDTNNYTPEQFRANAEQALARAASECKLLIVMTTPMQMSKGKRMSPSEVDGVLREVCTDNAYVHLSLLNCIPVNDEYYHRDRIHPTLLGHRTVWNYIRENLCL